MLKDLFIIESIVEEEDGVFLATAGINAVHPLFKGHFPQVPVLPGVCSLYLIRECTGRFLDSRLRYISIDSCKFTEMVNPLRNELIRIWAKTDTFSEGIKIKAVMHYGTRPVLKLQAVVKEIDI
ncbi:MAG TPA: hypothetical protein PKU85_04995 [Bacteroidales bacterium]|nr:MAG: (3R)-hydroxymyristoyl-ACP dehydratase [Bacteroidetes bacterium ADurb.Bin037]HPV88549.1 hypothetical protein [Bacteroidales bacterium]HPW79088.1 hypothetical protein [Bacteroidales bacterium]HQB56703.1 hypothetical protein [Bacteroidales bacterium]